MRRARIKAVATVPVRRKATLETPAAETVAETVVKTEIQSTEKPPEQKPEEKVEAIVEPIPVTVASKEIEKIIAPRTPEKEVVAPRTPENQTVTAKTPQTFLAAPKSPEKAAFICKTPEKLSVSPVKEKESGELKPDVQSIQPISIIESPPKPPASSVEGSPVKAIQNRSCFMRPTPRLDGGGRIRRNSIQGSGASASESEDDSRRSSSIAPSRVRNDSICSVQSLKDTGSASNIAKLNLGQKRRMVVSESARKLAEARREFHLKHENKCPDKSKLTMYDLIYYNPTTNPMKPKSATRPAARKISVCSIPEKPKEDEEDVDEPEEMVVPQVKVGPNGQIIIDEQSLVIDQYKAQENIDRSDILVDEDTNGNGFYKRRQKSKDWNKWETVKFYKALNTYGTDFLLMQSIFPKRTRQELKLKYKKEERLNNLLVEKALRYQEFDTEALEKDLANFEESEKKESERKKKEIESNRVKKMTNSSKRKRKRCQAVAEEVNCNDVEENTESNRKSGDEQSSDDNTKKKEPIVRKIRKRATRKRKEIESSTNSCNESENKDSDSEPEVYKAQPTRSGRASKIIKCNDKNPIEENSINVYDTNEEQTEQLNNQVEDVQNNNENNKKDIIINDLHDNDSNEILNNVDMIVNSKILIEGIDNVVDELNQIAKSTEIHTEIQSNIESENQKELLEILGSSSNVVSNAFDGIVDDIPNMANLKPGSLVVLKKDCADEPGKTTLQVYIVSADYDAKNPNCKDSLLPIDLSPDLLETVTNCIKDIEPQNISEECNVP